MPTSRFRQRKNSIEIIVRYLGVDANPRATAIRLKPNEQWDRKTQTVVGNDGANSRLLKYKTDLDELFYKLDRKGDPFTARDLVDYPFGVKEWNEKPHVLGAISAYNDFRKPEIKSGNLTEIIFKRFGRMERIMKDFLIYQYPTEKVALESLKPVFGKQLDSYFKVVKQYDPNTSTKYIRHYKSVFEYALANDWTTKNVLNAFRARTIDKPILYLTSTELARIEGLLIPPDSVLEKYRDMFVFCCWSGLSYKDIRNLKPEHLIEVEGQFCIVKPREKRTRNIKTTHFSPLFPATDAILRKYADHCAQTGFCFPMPSLNTYNKSLQGIGVAANITPLKSLPI